MSIIIFIIVLALLIFVHELGHFIVAKKFGIKVPEFGLGFPPKIFGKKIGETEYTLNWIPFGGFVRIIGENPSEEIGEEDKNRSLLSKPRYIQAAVISAGVIFNILFAWILISFGLMSGLPTSVDIDQNQQYLSDISLTITGVLPESPAEKSGLQIGDNIIALSVLDSSISNIESIEEAQIFIADHAQEEISLTYERNGEEITTVSMMAEEGIVDDRKVVGMSMDMVGLLKYPPHLAFWNGISFTANMTKNIAVGLWGFFSGLVTGESSLAQVAGPVGIIGLVGQASALGFIYLLSFTALISINLAIINLIPFPALDGGRLLFITIESIKRSPINPKFTTVFNGIGFALLILLMIAVTYNDIARLITG